MKTTNYLQFLFFVLILLNLHGLIFDAVLHAQTQRYVATNGSNSSNDCSNSSSPCATIAHAINEASSGDVINIAAGAYTQSQSGGLVIDKSITLLGEDRETTFIQAHAQPNQAGHRTITIEQFPIDVIIADVTIRHGVASGAGVPGRGGGLYYIFDPVNPGSLDINNAKFINNSARVGGGMFVTSEGAPELSTIIFQDNSATERGGGIYLYTNSEATINNVVFNGNSAGISGGGVYSNASNSTFIYCNFTSNYAATGCSGIAFQNGSAGTFTGGGFLNHQTAGVGGAVCVDGASNPEFSNVEFTNNESLGGRGGAVHIVNNSNPSFSGVQFSNNQVSGNQSGDGGGAAYIGAGSQPVFLNTTFSGNTAPVSDGGGIYATDSRIFIESVSFNNNQAVSGGAIYLSGNIGSPTMMHDVTFTENTADGSAGAFYVINSGTSLEDVVFTGNSAGDAGGALYTAGAQYFCSIRNGVFIGNSAAFGGGAILNYHESVSYYNVVFADNVANSGGAINNINSVTPYYYNLTFSGNTANVGGALHNSNSSTHFINNSVFWGNTATSAGNEIYNNSSSATMWYCLIDDNADNVVVGNGITFNNCIDDDPLFVDVPNHHFQLSENSPAIDAGDPNTSGMGFPHNGSNEPIDILGNPRFVGTIDIGAYEWNSNLSINEVSETVLDVILYPNPASEKLHIESNQTIDQLVIYDFLGKVMAASFSTNGANTTTVDLSGFASGLYVLQLTIEDQTASYKVVKH